MLHGRDTPAEHGGVDAAEPRGSARRPPSPRRAATCWVCLTNPGLMLLTGSYAAVGYYEYTLFYWMKYYFSDVLHYPEQTSRYFTSIVALSMVIAMPLGGIVSNALVRPWGYRASQSAVAVFGLLAGAVLLFAATHIEGPLLVVTLFFLAHAAIGLCEAQPGSPPWRSAARAAAPPAPSSTWAAISADCWRRSSPSTLPGNTAGTRAFWSPAWPACWGPPCGSAFGCSIRTLDFRRRKAGPKILPAENTFMDAALQGRLPQFTRLPRGKLYHRDQR